MRRAPLALAALIAAVLAGSTACTSSTEGISLGDVRRATVVEVVDVPASVTARAVATLTAPADGTLAKLKVEPGERVEAGDVVAVIDSPAARKRLANAKAALATARVFGRGGAVDLGVVQRDLDRAAADAFDAARRAAEQVADEKLRSALLAQLDASRSHYTAAAKTSKKLLGQVERGLASIGDAVAALGEAQRAQAKAAYDLAKSTVDALTLRAPIAGVVQFARPAAATGADPLAGLLGAVAGTGLAAEAAAGTAGATAAGQSVAGVDDVLAVGDHVGAGTAVVTIVDVSEIGLAGEVDETDVLLVQPGVTADVELDAAPGTRYQATVRSVDLLPTPSARGGVAYRLRLAFDADSSAGLPVPRPGMSAVAHLRVRTAQDAVTVPAAAVFSTPDGDAVWLVRDGKAVQQPVGVGVKGEELIQIVSGLAPGDRVVVSGADRVVAGLDFS